MTPSPPDPRYSIIVIELDDVVPRRDSKKPNLYVAKTVTDPEARFEAIKRSKKSRWYTDHILCLRQDLAPRRTYSSQEDAAAACTRLVKKLSKEGYTVNRDTKVWRVYVIELDKTAVTNPGKGYVYVGETSKTPEERFAQHRGGAKNKRGPLFSGVVRNHGLHLRPDLAPKRVFYDQESSKRAEKEHSELLKAKGYEVRGGH